MDFEEAKGMLAQTPAPEISDHRSKMASLYGDSPQKLESIDSPLRQIEVLLGDLMRHGHHYKLVEADAAPVVEFPKMLYRDDEQMVVQDEGELESALKDGWDVHPSLRQDPGPPVPSGPPTDVPPMVGGPSNSDQGAV